MKDIAVIVALVTAGTSLLVAVFSAVASFRAQRRLQRAGQQHDTVIENLKAELGRGSAEHDARLDYEYEAQKRLYQTCEPLFFQMTERFEDWHGRVYGLARTARLGKLEPQRGWLSGPGYYLRSTMYRLIAPVALYQLLAEQMTSVDLSVDARTRRRYVLAKQFAWSLTDHFDLAAVEPAIAYTPHDTGDDAVRWNDQPRYWTQGLTSVGAVDAAAQALIIRDGPHPRLLRFGEFDELYDVEGSPVQQSFCAFEYLMHDFHPRNRPVLWRMLIAQTRICVAFLDVSGGPPHNPLRRQQDREPELLDWRQSPEEAPDDDVLVTPFDAAATYLLDSMHEPPTGGGS